MRDSTLSRTRQARLERIIIEVEPVDASDFNNTFWVEEKVVQQLSRSGQQIVEGHSEPPFVLRLVMISS